MAIKICKQEGPGEYKQVRLEPGQEHGPSDQQAVVAIIQPVIDLALSIPHEHPGRPIAPSSLPYGMLQPSKEGKIVVILFFDISKLPKRGKR